MPSSVQSSETFVSGFPIAACANLSLAAVIFGLRPPLRPRARAEASPALVRSMISSRSNSANAAKIPNTSRPLAVVVSMLAPCPVSTVIERQASIQAWIVDDWDCPGLVDTENAFA